MDTTPASDFQEVLIHVVSDMAQAVSEHRGGSQQQRLAHAQNAARSVLAFQPADAVEAMIAGHCVMFHEMIVDTVQTIPRGESDATRRATRNSIVAMDKAFGNNLVRPAATSRRRSPKPRRVKHPRPTPSPKPRSPTA